MYVRNLSKMLIDRRDVMWCHQLLFTLFVLTVGVGCWHRDLCFWGLIHFVCRVVLKRCSFRNIDSVKLHDNRVCYSVMSCSLFIRQCNVVM